MRYNELTHNSIEEERDYHKGWEHGTYKNSAELVPVEWLAKLKGNELRYPSKANIGYNPDIDDWERGDEDELIASMQKAIQEPVMISVGLKDGYAYIGEGNHRISAALKAGIKQLPTRIYMTTTANHKRGPKTYTHDMNHDITWDPATLEAFPKEKYYNSPSQVFKSLQ